MTVGTRSMNSSRVRLPVECSFRLVKNGEAIEVGDEEVKVLLVFMFMFMFTMDEFLALFSLCPCFFFW